MIFKNVTFYNEVFQKDVADIQVENGRITAIGVLGQEGRDMQGYTLLPGFVDIHIHGRGGGDFSDGTVSSMDRISASLAKCGVNKDELNDEERSNNGDTDVVLLVLTGEERDEHISDRADTDTVGDRVGQRHHDESEERRNSAAQVGHIDLCEALDIFQGGARIKQCLN